MGQTPKKPLHDTWLLKSHKKSHKLTSFSNWFREEPNDNP